MKASGKMTFRRGMEQKYGKTVANTPGTTSMAKNMESAFTNGPIQVSIMANGPIIRSTAKAFTNGQMAGNTTGSGSITTCMGTAPTPGSTAELTRASTNTIRNTDSESTNGLMAKGTKATGKKESKTAREPTFYKMEHQLVEYGRMDKKYRHEYLKSLHRF